MEENKDVRVTKEVSDIKELGNTNELKRDKSIQVLSIIGQIEGHADLTEDVIRLLHTLANAVLGPARSTVLVRNDPCGQLDSRLVHDMNGEIRRRTHRAANPNHQMADPLRKSADAHRTTGVTPDELDEPRNVGGPDDATVRIRIWSQAHAEIGELPHRDAGWIERAADGDSVFDDIGHFREYRLNNRLDYRINRSRRSFGVRIVRRPSHGR